MHMNAIHAPDFAAPPPRRPDDEIVAIMVESGWDGMSESDVIQVLVDRGIRPSETSGDVAAWRDAAKVARAGRAA